MTDYGVITEDLRRTVVNVNVLTNPPAPVLTLEEAKLAAGLDWPPGDPRDSQMEAFMRAAVERVERDTGIALLTQTREIYLAHLVPPSDFPGPCRPIQSIEDIASPDPEWYPWARRVVVGYLDQNVLPPLLYHAVALLTAHFATAGRDAVIVGTIGQPNPLGYDELIHDYRRVAV